MISRHIFLVKIESILICFLTFLIIKRGSTTLLSYSGFPCFFFSNIRSFLSSSRPHIVDLLFWDLIIIIIFVQLQWLGLEKRVSCRVILSHCSGCSLLILNILWIKVTYFLIIPCSRQSIVSASLWHGYPASGSSARNGGSRDTLFDWDLWNVGLTNLFLNFIQYRFTMTVINYSSTGLYSGVFTIH